MSLWVPQGPRLLVVVAHAFWLSDVTVPSLQLPSIPIILKAMHFWPTSPWSPDPAMVWLLTSVICMILLQHTVSRCEPIRSPYSPHSLPPPCSTTALPLASWSWKPGQNPLFPSPSLYLCINVYFIIHTWMILNVKILIIMKRQNGNRNVWVDMETKPLSCARMIKNYKYYSFVSIHFLPFFCPAATLAQTSIISHVHGSCLLFLCILPVCPSANTGCISYITMVKSHHQLQPSHGFPFIT